MMSAVGLFSRPLIQLPGIELEDTADERRRIAPSYVRSGLAELAKYWLARSGLIDSAEVRLPMVEVSAELAALLDEEIERRRPQILRRA